MIRKGEDLRDPREGPSGQIAFLTGTGRCPFALTVIRPVHFVGRVASNIKEEHLISLSQDSYHRRPGDFRLPSQILLCRLSLDLTAVPQCRHWEAWIRCTILPWNYRRGSLGGGGVA